MINFLNEKLIILKFNLLVENHNNNMSSEEDKKFKIKLMRDEQWKPIEGHEKYLISNWGRVWSHLSHVFLKQHINHDGYAQITLDRNTMRIHCLVAKSFIPNPDHLDTVDHINNDITNNYVWNLQWLSALDNGRKRKNRTSRFLHVSLDRQNQRWLAQLPKYGKSKYFRNELEAAEQANIWIKELGLPHPLNQLNNNPIRLHPV